MAGETGRTEGAEDDLVHGGRAARVGDGLRVSPDESGGQEFDVRTPDGEMIGRGQRVTFREARPWVRRGSTLLGVQACGTPVAWVVGDDRPVLVARFRRCEGGDCNPAGDVLLFRLSDGRRAALIKES